MVNFFRCDRVDLYVRRKITADPAKVTDGNGSGRGLASGAVGLQRHLGVAVTSTGKTAEADTACIDAGQTLRQAGHLMRKLGVGTLMVRGDNGDVQGTISSDTVVRRIAAGGDPKTVTVGEVASAASPGAVRQSARQAALAGARRSRLGRCNHQLNSPCLWHEGSVTG